MPCRPPAIPELTQISRLLTGMDAISGLKRNKYIYPGLNSSMRNQPFWLMAVLILLCAGCAGMAGCLSQDDTPLTEGDISVIPAGPEYPDYAGTYLEGPLRITVPEFGQYWTAEGTCYWEGRIQVENTGVETENDVILRSSLIDIESGTTVDTTSKTFQRVSENDTFTFVVQLHGECDGKYTIRVETFVD